MSWISKLFKKEERAPEHREIIYKRELTVNNQFISPGLYGPLIIITYVLKTRDYKGRVEYEIKKNLPLTKNPSYDGDHSTNRTIERCGHTEWIRAEYAIDKDKIESQTKTGNDG